jgi:site-specific DNA-methyltransferase (adenine-specific)
MTIEVGKVGMIPINKVIVGERAREVMGDIEGLRDNMKESGLISPLAVKDNHDGTYLLLAGERRFVVLMSEENTEIPARIYDRDLSLLEMKVIEKSENFFRKDMEYYEFDRLTLEIHNMNQELYGIKPPGPNQEGWSTSDTAEMVGLKSQGDVSRAIARAKARDAYPELFQNCKTADDASKLISKVSEAAVRQQIAQTLETQTANIDLQHLNQAYNLKDFFEGVKSIPDGIMHLVEIDPPYGIDLTKQKMKDGESQYDLNSYNEIDSTDYKSFLHKLFRECYRVMAPNSWLICWFAPQPWFETVYQEILAPGLTTTRMCGIWAKTGSGQNMNPTIRLSNNYEMFFYAWKGQPVLNMAGRSNVFHYAPVNPREKTHPTERPIELMKELYDTFAFPGSRVLIPFLGSGNGLLAATQLGMSAIGFELSKSYKDSFLVKANLMLQK